MIAKFHFVSERQESTMEVWVKRKVDKRTEITGNVREKRRRSRS